MFFQGAENAPNNSFKPNLLRYTKAMAEKACHGFGSTTQVGLTQALGLMPIPHAIGLLFFAVTGAFCVKVLSFGLCHGVIRPRYFYGPLLRREISLRLLVRRLSLGPVCNSLVWLHLLLLLRPDLPMRPNNSFKPNPLRGSA